MPTYLVSYELPRAVITATFIEAKTAAAAKLAHEKTSAYPVVGVKLVPKKVAAKKTWSGR